MSTEQPEALRLAEDLEIYGPLKHTPPISKEYKAAAELRRLHSVNAELLEALKNLLVAFPGEYESAPSHITNARAAIAKAKGDS
jgi:hypothetical protein